MSADHYERTALLQFAQDHCHSRALHDHPGEADDIHLRDAVEVDLFDALIR